MRPLGDYQKVRRIVGWCRRNVALQSRSTRLRQLDYLNAGCGPHPVAGFVNLDYRWVPGVHVVWDLTRPLPFAVERFKGIFSEHVLEHFYPADMHRVLLEFHRVLRPGGRLRVVVPSLEIHARRYVAERVAGRDDDPAPADLVNNVFYAGHENMKRSRWVNDGHHFLHDFATLGRALRDAGFIDVGEEQARHGADPRLVIDLPERTWESLYVECVKAAP